MVAQKASLNELLSRLDGGKVLDVGTGSGNFAVTMLQHFKKPESVIAIDTNSSSLLQIKQQNPLSEIIPIVMSGDMLGFSDGTFDTVSISNSIHHLKSPQILLREMVRTLKKGGFLIIREMFSDGDQTEAQMTHTLMHNWWATIDTHNNITHNQVFKRKEIISEVKKLNLNSLEIHDIEDLSADPFDPETIEYLSTALKKYLKRVEENPGLFNQGQLAIRQLNEHGFCNARSLLIVARKD